MTVQEVSKPCGSQATGRAAEEFRNLAALLLFMFVTALVFRNWEFALIITASLGFHELGHVLALSVYGLEGRIFFGLIGAWTWSSLRERSRLSQLANVYIHLTGPLFSLILATLAMTINRLWQPESRHLLILANFSAQVGLLNLLPAGSLTDGGKIVQRMLISLDGKKRLRVLLIPVILTLFILVLYVLIELPRLTSLNSSAFLLSLLLTGVWMAASMLLEAQSTRKSSRAVFAARPMKPAEVNFVTILMWNMLAYYLLMISITPFWLEPDYVKGSLENIVAVLNIVVNFI